MSSHRGIGLYRALLRCYPRSFRNEYGPDMFLLFSDQLDDGSDPRVWGRGVIDLAITIPTRHLEAHMHRPANSLVPLLFAALSVAAGLVALLGGTNLALAGGALAVAVAAGILGVLAARQTRPVTSSTSTTAQWWKLLAGGVAPRSSWSSLKERPTSPSRCRWSSP